jgi:uncharacterized protein YceK
VKNRISLLMVVTLFLSGCSSSPSVTPESYGARAGEDGAKYWKKQNPGQVASPESAGAYCSSMAEDGGKQYGWTINEILQASDSCGIWFTTEMFRK